MKLLVANSEKIKLMLESIRSELTSVRVDAFSILDGNAKSISVDRERPKRIEVSLHVFIPKRISFDGA